MQGHLTEAADQFNELVAEAAEAHDLIWHAPVLSSLGQLLAYQGDSSAARTTADSTIEAATEIGEIFTGLGYVALTYAALAAGDGSAASDASATAWQYVSVQREVSVMSIDSVAQAALARGDVTKARQWCDDAVSMTTGFHLARALTTRVRVALAQGELEAAERDAHEALEIAAEIGAHLCIPDVVECLACRAYDAGSHREATRYLGAAEAMRQRMGSARFKVYKPDHDALVAAVRDALGDNDFDAGWAEGVAL
jgi:tetratricopeptide (TPR) repeat protein